MLNYKQALYEALTNEAQDKKYLNDYSIDFIDEHDGGDSQYIFDAIAEFADGNTSIYYSDIKRYISENIDAVTDIINEFGWDGCGCDLYKAGQAAEMRSIESEIYNDLDDIVLHIAACCVANFDDDEETAQKWDMLTEEQRAEIIDDLLSEIQAIDSNSRFDEIADAIGEAVEAINDAVDLEDEDE